MRSYIAVLIAAGAICMVECQAPPRSCSCSHTARSRIKGGMRASKADFPWLVAIRVNKDFNCGGSLINDRYVLTAGHCISDYDNDYLDVVIGATNELELGSEVTIRPVVERKLFENYLPEKAHDRHDIALLRIEPPLDIERIHTTICLPPRDRMLDGHMTEVAGWGIADDGQFSHDLLKGKVRTMDRSNCLRNSGYSPNEIDPDHFCAADVRVDACTGDSGGPAMLYIDRRVEQLGVISWGRGCANTQYPGVYISVPYYLDWIRKNTLDGRYCKL